MEITVTHYSNIGIGLCFATGTYNLNKNNFVPIWQHCDTATLLMALNSHFTRLHYSVMQDQLLGRNVTSISSNPIDYTTCKEPN